MPRLVVVVDDDNDDDCIWWWLMPRVFAIPLVPAWSAARSSWREESSNSVLLLFVPELSGDEDGDRDELEVKEPARLVAKSGVEPLPSLPRALGVVALFAAPFFPPPPPPLTPAALASAAAAFSWRLSHLLL